MSRILLLSVIVFAAFPNLSIIGGVLLLDLLVLIFILVNAFVDRKVLLELLAFTALLALVLFYRFVFYTVNLTLYLDYIIRFVLLYGLIIIPKKRYRIRISKFFWVILLAYLLFVVSNGAFDMLVSRVSRKDIEYIYFNDTNILFFTLYLVVFISRIRSAFVSILVLILSIVLGARIATLIGLYYFFMCLGRRGLVFLGVLALLTVVWMPSELFDNIVLLDRLSSGIDNNEYSRATLWAVHSEALLNECSWCYIEEEFSQIGLRSMRPAHNFFLSTLAMNGLVVGFLIILRTIFKFRRLIDFQHIWLFLIVMFFDLQFSRGLLILLLIYNASRDKEFRSFNFSF